MSVKSYVFGSVILSVDSNCNTTGVPVDLGPVDLEPATDNIILVDLHALSKVKYT